MPRFERIGGSFRDPNGFVFSLDGEVHRQVNQPYQAHYERLMQSGLYQSLVADELLIAHEEVDAVAAPAQGAYKILRPQQLPFVSYPYEWCFSQLKDAALTTLRIQKRALAQGMTLKDASAYNIQFLDGKPRLIDTLSFETLTEGGAWVAYRQFCQHFLAPLALMSCSDIRLSQLLRAHIDGIPLDLAARLLPKRAWLNTGLAMHLLLHARAQKRYAGSAGQAERRKRLGKRDLLNIADSLRSTIQGLRWDPGGTSWSDYYAGDSYDEAGFEHKQQLVADYIALAAPRRLWDLGANTGRFSRIASGRGIFTLSMDNDPGVVEANYLKAKNDGETALHPLLVDLANPSPAMGWANEERDSLAARGPADCALALALLHHLAISNNVPLQRIAAFFASLAPRLIIEFVPKRDPKVQTLLATREDIFVDYERNAFERVFGEVYEIMQTQQLRGSERVLYLMRRRG